MFLLETQSQCVFVLSNELFMAPMLQQPNTITWPPLCVEQLQLRSAHRLFTHTHTLQLSMSTLMLLSSESLSQSFRIDARLPFSLCSQPVITQGKKVINRLEMEGGGGWAGGWLFP